MKETRLRPASWPAFIMTMLAMTAILLTACGGTDDVTYTPAAYGAGGHCFYVQDPGEVLALQAAGLCPRSWAPALMPLGWHQQYYGYYDSPAYYSRYVPAGARSSYVRRQADFGRAYHTVIAARSKTGTYRSSTGGVAPGAKVMTGKTRFGPGTSFGGTGQKFGGGGLRPVRGGGHGGR